MNYPNFAEQKALIEETIVRLKAYISSQELLPEEKRQQHLGNIIASLEGNEQALIDLDAYTSRPIEELEKEARQKLDAANLKLKELWDRYPKISGSAIVSAREKVYAAEKLLEHISLLK